MAAPAELRREGNVFLIGGELSPQETLETLFESHCMTPAELFHLSFGGIEAFPRGEELARLVKKNFNAHLIGRIDYPPSAATIGRVYAAGIDIIDIPLPCREGSDAEKWRQEREKRLAALDHALAILPRWGVLSTLALAGELPAVVADIDLLFARGVVPLLELSPLASRHPAEKIAEVYRHLAGEWRRLRVTIAPLLPLIVLGTPLVLARQGGILRGFIDRMRDRQLLAASDLRRALRVQQVEESFESAGL